MDELISPPGFGPRHRTHDYDVFGGRLRSDLTLTGVPESRSPGEPDWVVRTHEQAAEQLATAPVAEVVEDGFTVRLHQRGAAWRLVYSDTGTYDVSADGASIRWHPGPVPIPELAQADILGRVLALALSAAGALPLHGSAVALGAGSVVVLGNKHSGKSTFAGALTAAGARLVTDDMAAVELGADVLLRPGVPQLRLWADAAGQVLTDTTCTRTPGVKHTLADFPLERVELSTTSLRAIYVLDPLAAGTDIDGAPCARTRLAPLEATLALLVHGKMGGLLGGSLAATFMARAAEVVRRVPVFSLRMVRDLNRLPAIATALLDWHRERAVAALEPR